MVMRQLPQVSLNIFLKTHNPKGCIIALILLIRKLKLREGSFLKVT